jgi:hypothetical protein
MQFPTEVATAAGALLSMTTPVLLATGGCLVPPAVPADVGQLDASFLFCPDSAMLECGRSCGDACWDLSTKTQGPCCGGLSCVDELGHVQRASRVANDRGICRPQCSLDSSCAVCDAQTCWDGCCEASGTCHARTPFVDCGANGQACGPDCLGVPIPTCGPSNCPDGCCFRGHCVAQTERLCGRNGAACSECYPANMTWDFSQTGCNFTTGQCVACPRISGPIVASCQNDTGCCEGTRCDGGVCIRL